jgi:Helicase conserved C-terminal domain
MCIAVDDALAQWVDRRSRPVTRIEKPRSRPKVRIPRPTVAPVALERPPTTDDRYTPTRLVRRLGDALRGYIENAYPLADPILVRARRVLLEPFGLLAAEHSAQLTGTPDDSAFNKVEEYELRFQDIAIDGKLPIDILSCTTTMEVGIDIGALSGVALRNVPPHVANYQQRAGRAGRRGRSIASVVTYAHGTSHDAHFFSHPEAMICGAVRPPIVYVENQQVLTRHIHAYLLQRFFHERVPTDTGANAYVLFESLGTVGQFLSEDHPCFSKSHLQWSS